MHSTKTIFVHSLVSGRNVLKLMNLCEINKIEMEGIV